MYLVPVLEQSRGFIQQFWLFLERNGTHLMEIQAGADPSAAAQEFAAANEISMLGEPEIVDDYVFVKVDPATPDLGGFYSWKEVAPGTAPPKEAWRSFLWAGSHKESDPWGVNRMLEDISLAEAPHTAYKVLSALLTLRPSAEST